MTIITEHNLIPEPLFGCKLQCCSEEVSYPSHMLYYWPGSLPGVEAPPDILPGFYCEDCLDEYLVGQWFNQVKCLSEVLLGMNDLDTLYALGIRDPNKTLCDACDKYKPNNEMTEKCYPRKGKDDLVHWICEDCLEGGADSNEE